MSHRTKASFHRAFLLWGFSASVFILGLEGQALATSYCAETNATKCTALTNTGALQFENEAKAGKGGHTTGGFGARTFPKGYCQGQLCAGNVTCDFIYTECEQKDGKWTYKDKEKDKAKSYKAHATLPVICPPQEGSCEAKLDALKCVNDTTEYGPVGNDAFLQGRVDDPFGPTPTIIPRLPKPKAPSNQPTEAVK